MIVSFDIENKTYKVDLSKPIDISISLIFNNLDNPNAWYCPAPDAEAQRFGDFEISVDTGAAVNSYSVKIFPHGNGTHTEGVGHLLKKELWETYSINRVIKEFHSLAQVISIYPLKIENGDRVIFKHQLEDIFNNINNIYPEYSGLIIRTLPNDDLKKKQNWSGSNPPYLEADALAYLAQNNIQHLLIDLPSVDKEDDGGAVAAHRAFWQLDGQIRSEATITEMIFVPNDIKDGLYFLNLQIPSFELDAAPSKPVLYNLL
jgi:arylformamidase